MAADSEWDLPDMGEVALQLLATTLPAGAGHYVAGAMHAVPRLALGSLELH